MDRNRGSCLLSRIELKGLHQNLLVSLTRDQGGRQTSSDLRIFSYYTTISAGALP